MAEFMKYTASMQAEWDAWVASRPPIIQEMCNLVKPNVLYRLKTGAGTQRVTVCSYNENGTLTVDITGQFNSLYAVVPMLERSVFGIKPEDLEECDLPEGIATIVFDSE